MTRYSVNFAFRASLILILFAISAGCTQKSNIPVDEIPDIGVPIDDMNTKFGIWIPKGYGNTYKNRESLAMMVTVISSDEIGFSVDLNARIFTYDNGQWEEIDDTMIQEEGSEILIFLRPSKDDFTLSSTTAVLVPYKPGLDKEIWIRVFLTGSIIKNGEVTEDKTASFIDVPLKP